MKTILRLTTLCLLLFAFAKVDAQVAKVKKKVFLNWIMNDSWKRISDRTKFEQVKAIAVATKDKEHMILIKDPTYGTDKEGNQWVADKSQTIRIKHFEGKVKVIRCACNEAGDDDCKIVYDSQNNEYKCENDDCCKAEVWLENGAGAVVRTIQ